MNAQLNHLAQNESVIGRLVRQCWSTFLTWFFEPIPFPRDHWFEFDRQRQRAEMLLHYKKS